MCAACSTCLPKTCDAEQKFSIRLRVLYATCHGQDHSFDANIASLAFGMPILAILKTMAHGIVWGSFAKSTIGCGPVFNAPWQQQENPSIHVIHCGLDSKNNIQ